MVTKEKRIRLSEEDWHKVFIECYEKTKRKSKLKKLKNTS